MSKLAATGLFFSFLGVLVWLSLLMTSQRGDLLLMDEPVPANSPIKTEEQILDEMIPSDQVADIVVAEGARGSFILRESVPDPLPAINAPLPPPPSTPPPPSIMVIVVPEQPSEPTMIPVVTTTGPPITTTTNPPVETTDPPVETTTEPPVETTTEPPTTTVDPTTTTTAPTTTENSIPTCDIGLILDPVLGLCVQL